MRVSVNVNILVHCEEKQAGEVIERLTSNLSEVGGVVVSVNANTMDLPELS